MFQLSPRETSLQKKHPQQRCLFQLLRNQRWQRQKIYTLVLKTMAAKVNHLTKFVLTVQKKCSAVVEILITPKNSLSCPTFSSKHSSEKFWENSNKFRMSFEQRIEGQAHESLICLFLPFSWRLYSYIKVFQCSSNIWNQNLCEARQVYE